jgi:hypothetical protein
MMSPAGVPCGSPSSGAASAAQPIPADVTTTEQQATADDGTPIRMRWYAKDGAADGAGAPHECDSIAFDSDVARPAIADRVRVLKSI